ncbi:mahogunin ring finger 1 isoform X2 [Arctopsyche grandis]|uniref:mahogunin ring finger 1 isoform X2 n=1 Tax=Arctopsyche grandis TaxID=121162 RepID=UPI00406D6BC3
MGSLGSRQAAAAEHADVAAAHAYRYPPPTGNYFGSHFIMGGERFDTPQPEAYLFGENADLNFLGSRPTPFPYPPPQANEPTKTLKSLVNIRKESLRFVRCADPIGKVADQGDGTIPIRSTQFNIEFTFDCDSRCCITIYYFCSEEFTPNGVVYNPKDSTMNSHTYRYKRGANQQFCQTTHIFDPSKYSEEDLLYNPEKDVLPIAIHCVVEEGSEELRQSHTTIAVIEKHTDGTYVLKALKQKLYVDGLCYLLQEIYGIENKNLDNSKVNGDEDCEDNGSECVICMCDVRDTLILPCRHLCLCNSCADSLRYQANNCPICRAPFRALLQIRALQKQTGQAQHLPASPPDGSSENIPAGYEAVSLIEALNGPCPVRVQLPPPTPLAPHQTSANNNTPLADGELSIQTVEAESRLNRCSLERHSSNSIGANNKIKSVPAITYKTTSKDLEGKSPRDRALAQANASEIDDDYNVDDLDAELESQEGELDCEGDSETEKLSPLLTESCNDAVPRNKNDSINLIENGQNSVGRLPLHLEAVLEPIDDTDTDEPEQLSSASVAGPPCLTENETGVPAEDSDYFTPEDTHTTILSSPNQQANIKNDTIGNIISSTESTPQRWALPHHVTSLPGTPLSHLSNRSSGDSYSSSSSTKQLLAGVNPPNVPTHHPHSTLCQSTIHEK